MNDPETTTRRVAAAFLVLAGAVVSVQGVSSELDWVAPLAPILALAAATLCWRLPSPRGWLAFSLGAIALLSLLATLLVAQHQRNLTWEQELASTPDPHARARVARAALGALDDALARGVLRAPDASLHLLLNAPGLQRVDGLPPWEEARPLPNRLALAPDTDWPERPLPWAGEDGVTVQLRVGQAYGLHDTERLDAKPAAELRTITIRVLQEGAQALEVERVVVVP